MDWQPIKKSLPPWQQQPNLIDYQQTCADFSWDTVRDKLDGLPDGGGLNIAHEAVDRHATGDASTRVALRWLGKGGQVKNFTYAELKAQSNRFANVLRFLEVGKGERVFSLSGRIPELYFAALGTLKNISVFCPLFSA
ncbi:MAG: AMP-binding protein, partial [Desulfuromonadales bacterium]|nr:AMP-binding protein [Desulfuromonadales bacterium]